MSSVDRESGIESESAILVGVHLASDRPSVATRNGGASAGNGHGGNGHTVDPLDELAGLVETAGAKVVGRVTQNRPNPDPATYIGQGKVQEIKQFVDAIDADVVVFDNELSPAQIRNLEEAFEAKVLDRTEIILDIFSSRAQTHEARLAVELAQLEYSLPRLKRMWTHLSRMKMGVGMRGPGEKQLETDRRLVEKRINDLRNDLKIIEKRKERAVAARSDRMTVSLVGYTNAGKSTLMNRLTDANVLAEDKLFATLDTRTRRWQLPGWGPVLLSDTVGFIRNLPHHLVASFKATLEEARQADLLIHVADASNPAAMDQISSVYEVLRELDIDEKDTLLVLNQVDRVSDTLSIEALRTRYPNAILMSAVTGEGVSRLANSVSEALSREFLDLEIQLDASNGKLLAFLAQYGEVLSRTYVENRTVVHCRISQKYLGRLQDQPDVQIRNYKSAVIPQNGVGRLGVSPTEKIDEVA